MTAISEARARGGLARAVDSRRIQFAALIVAALVVAVPHWQNDGLWFQGDAPRHAATGFLYWDLLTTLPRHPLDYSLSYFARYPVISAGAYPPLFHIIEGAAFALIAPSPYVAKGLVLASALLAGIYTMQWGRRWIDPVAGWAGAAVLLLPGVVLYSNTVLLNVPAAAIGVAALYHLHAWLETAKARDRTLFVWLTAAAILTYYPGGLVLPVAVTWIVCFGARERARFLWMLVALLGLVLLVTLIFLPTHLARQMPSFAKLTSSINWLFYSHSMLSLFGLGWCLLAAFGLLVGLATPDRRGESARLALAFVSAVVCLALLPARDERYALLLGPLVVLTAFVAIRSAADVARRWRGVVGTALVVAALGMATRSALRVAVPDISGVDQVVRYLRANGPTDAVLYSGMHDGTMGFYMRALDPGFDGRLVLSNRLLYDYQQALDFVWVETPHVASPDDVVALIQTRSGCRWIAVEVGGEAFLTSSELLLRRTLERPEFERVRSFPMTGRPVTRIDLYRFIPPLAPAAAMDLRFPSFSTRIFRGVQPIPSRR